MTRQRLNELTDRWRRRHEARRSSGSTRPLADPAREQLAARAFPYRSITPEAYVAEHGDAMTAFTYDDASYTDATLDAWLVEVGLLLRDRRGR